MLTIGFLGIAIGAILILFNTVNFKFVKDQNKSKTQVIIGVALLIIGVVLFAIAVKNLMQAA